MEEGFDYIITGGGSAGCVLANRLSADPSVSVLLLEAGGSDWHPFFHWPAGFAKMTRGIGSWGWHTVPQRQLKGRVLRFTQAKVIGGGSSINAQIYTRGVPADYDDWERLAGATGWAWRDVLPYFKRSENNQRFANEFHAYGGPLGVSNPISPLPICEAFFQAGQELGIPFNADFNGAAQEGLGYYQLTQLDARRSSTAIGFLDAAVRRRPNLGIRLRSQALRVIVEQGRAVGVEIASGRAKSVVRAKREVIVSSGAIGSPKLLLQSGIGPAEHLRSVGVPVVHDLPGVGANLQDHLDLFAIAECTGDHTYDSYNKPLQAAWAGLQYLLLKKGPVASSLFETGGFWYAGGKGDRARSPDIQFHLGLGSGIEAGMAKLKNAGVTLNTAYLRPKSRGTVRLASADPAAAPLLDPNYWSEPEDRELAIRGLRLAREILRQPALKRFVQNEVLPGAALASDAELFDYACANAKTDHHPVGTCRIGRADDPWAVVTPELRLIGVDGLRVVNASVIPFVPSCNTNAPTVMVAEKAADHILGRL